MERLDALKINFGTYWVAGGPNGPAIDLTNPEADVRVPATLPPIDAEAQLQTEVNTPSDPVMKQKASKTKSLLKTLKENNVKQLKCQIK